MGVARWKKPAGSRGAAEKVRKKMIPLILMGKSGFATATMGTRAGNGDE